MLLYSILLFNNSLLHTDSDAFNDLILPTALIWRNISIQKLSYSTARDCWSVKHVDFYFPKVFHLNWSFLQNKSHPKQLNVKQSNLSIRLFFSQFFIEKMDYIGANDW